jgi:putative DNA primase/helicase
MDTRDEEVETITGYELAEVLADGVTDGVADGVAPGRLGLAADPRFEMGHLTDLGNAARIANECWAVLRWCEGRGWLHYQGGVWRRDKSAPRRYTVEMIRFYRELIPEFYSDWMMTSEGVARIKAAVELAKQYIPLDQEALDRDPWVLNVANGTIDLHAGTLGTHRAEDLITRIAPVGYDPKASAPTFERFLDVIFGDDEDLIRYVQRVVGYVLLGGTAEQVLFVAYGSGSNGKTVLLEVLHDVLGSYAAKLLVESLMKRPAGGIPNDLARLPGVRLVTAVESDVDRNLAEGLVKGITGSDTILARFLYGEFFEFRPQFTIWLATNHLPRISGTDHGIWRRIKVIPFNVTIPDGQQDKDLPMKLRAELPGILAWAVEGCLMYQAEGLGEPGAVTDAVAAYRTSQDPVGLWIDDAAVLDDDAWTPSKDLSDSFNAWAAVNGYEELAARTLGHRLRERGLVDRRGMQGGKRYRGWDGIGLANRLDPSTVPWRRSSASGRTAFVTDDASAVDSDHPSDHADLRSADPHGAEGFVNPAED